MSTEKIKRRRVSPEKVKEVKSYLSDVKYENLTFVEIGKLCDVSNSTVTRINNGDYDDLLVVNSTKSEETSESATTIIPLDDLRRLVACEYIVDAILRQTRLSDKYDNTLFIHAGALHGILRAYLPEDVEDRLETLKREEEN
jgi:hypothetical protein